MVAYVKVFPLGDLLGSSAMISLNLTRPPKSVVGVANRSLGLKRSTKKSINKTNCATWAATENTKFANCHMQQTGNLTRNKSRVKYSYQNKTAYLSCEVHLLHIIMIQVNDTLHSPSAGNLTFS